MLSDQLKVYQSEEPEVGPAKEAMEASKYPSLDLPEKNENPRFMQATIQPTCREMISLFPEGTGIIRLPPW